MFLHLTEELSIALNEGVFRSSNNMQGEREGFPVEKEYENSAIITGKVCEAPVFTHSIFGEAFYTFKVEVPRLSDYTDILPITASERLLTEGLAMNSLVTIVGQIRSYNKVIDGANRLVLTVFARDLMLDPEQKGENPNQVVLTGCICKPPIYRMTPFEREISDLLVAVNRAYNKSDYIPCIAWGRNARFAKTLGVGQLLRIHGRMQSREYEKLMPDGTKLVKVAYEVSVSSLEKKHEVSGEDA